MAERSLRAQVARDLRFIARWESLRQALGGRAARVDEHDIAQAYLGAIFGDWAPWDAILTPAEITRFRTQCLEATKTQMAEILNVSVSTVDKWERGTRRPSGISRRLMILVLPKGPEILS